MDAQMLKFTPGWYLLYTRPKQEKNVVKQLKEKCIDTFLPQMQKITTHGIKKKLSSVIMFPSYAFVYLSSAKEFLKGADTRGVVNYVRIGKVPAKVSEKTIADIKQVVGSDEYYEVSDEKFDISGRYLIESGPLAGMDCEIVEHRGSFKALIRVLLLERSVLIDLNNME